MQTQTMETGKLRCGRSNGCVQMLVHMRGAVSRQSNTCLTMRHSGTKQACCRACSQPACQEGLPLARRMHCKCCTDGLPSWLVQLIKGLEAARGNGTSMISLIMPPKDQVANGFTTHRALLPIPKCN